MSGLVLIELVVALAILGMVVITATALFLTTMQGQLQVRGGVAVIEGLRTGMESMAREIRAGSGFQYGAATHSATCGNQSIQFTRTLESGAIATIVYCRNLADGALMRSQNGGAAWGRITSSSVTLTSLTFQQVAGTGSRIAIAAKVRANQGRLGEFVFSASVAPRNVAIASLPPSFDFALSNGGNVTLGFNSSWGACSPRCGIGAPTSNNTITAVLVSGTGQPVSFAYFMSGGPPGQITGTFSQPSCTPNCSTTLTFENLAPYVAGQWAVAVTGVAGAGSKTTQFTLTVSPPACVSESPPSGGWFDVTNAGACNFTAFHRNPNPSDSWRHWYVDGITAYPGGSAQYWLQPIGSPPPATPLPLPAGAQFNGQHQVLTVPIPGVGPTVCARQTITGCP